jgi:hypothetical protein
MKKFLGLLLVLTAPVASTVYAQRRELNHDAGPARERRVALVIGNAAYKNGPLRNPVNDARAVTRALSELGFEVIHREDLGREDLRRAIREFSVKIQQGGVGLFYYAGHGVQIKGENYIVPVDAAPESADEVDDDAVNVSYVLEKMEAAGNRLNVLILDACRNNLFTRSFRSGSDGLAVVNAPTGTLIAYATAPGAVASDGGTAGNGVYTQELLRFMRTPGLSIEEVFKRVRIAVRGRTQGRQTPWEASSLEGDFYFNVSNQNAGGRKAAAPVAEPKTNSQPAVDTHKSADGGTASAPVSSLPYLPGGAAPPNSLASIFPRWEYQYFGGPTDLKTLQSLKVERGKLSEIKDKRKVLGINVFERDLKKYDWFEVVSRGEEADFFIQYSDVWDWDVNHSLNPLSGITAAPERLPKLVYAAMCVYVRGAKGADGLHSPRIVWSKKARLDNDSDPNNPNPKGHPRIRMLRDFIEDLRKVK